MKQAEVKSHIVPGGLRYKSKPSGSPFGESTQTANSTMSCLYCGKHRNRTLLKGAQILGRTQMVCKPNCKSVDEAIAKL